MNSKHRYHWCSKRAQGTMDGTNSRALYQLNNFTIPLECETFNPHLDGFTTYKK